MNKRGGTREKGSLMVLEMVRKVKGEEDLLKYLLREVLGPEED